MELLCLGVIFLWAAFFGLVCFSPFLVSGVAFKGEETIVNIFPQNSAEIFINADKILLYPLDKTESKHKRQFYDYYFAQELELNDKQAKELKENFIKTADIRSNGKPFAPTYGLRVKKGEEFVDILVSFENSNFIIHFNGKSRGGSFNKSASALSKVLQKRVNEKAQDYIIAQSK